MSRWASGSSSSSRSGLRTRHAASATSLRSPPDIAGRRAIEHRVVEAEVAQQPDGVAVDRLVAELVDQGHLALQQPRHAAQVVGQRRIGQRLLDLGQLRLQGGGGRDGGAHRVQRRAVVAGDELGQVGQRRALADRQRARVGRLDARQQAQDGGLARAVGADEAHAGARADLEVEPVEHAAAAEALDDAAQAEGWCGGDADGHSTTTVFVIGHGAEGSSP